MNIGDDVAAIAEARKPSLITAADAKEAIVNVGVDRDSSLRKSSEIPTPDEDEPTLEELQTLRRVSGKIPWLAYTVAFVELCERFSVCCAHALRPS